MSSINKLRLLAILTVTVVVATFLFPSVAQSLSFHRFADTRPLLGIPNFGNVASNLPFLLVGLGGLALVWTVPVGPAIRTIYAILFAGVVCTGLGSAWYHLNPNNDTLVWDRVPMTIVFMSLLSATIAELVSRRLGIWLLLPLVFTGIASVLWWHYTELLGKGDLRLYMLIQFYPMLLIPLLLWLYYTPSVKPTLRALVWVVVWYMVAKLFEQLDQPVYRLTGISGHTLKHLAAAMSTWYFLVMFRNKYFRKQASTS